MASGRHVDVVHSGAEAIREWRSRRRRKFDLAGAKFRQGRLADADLHLANCAHADFTGADLERADLSKAVLSNADLTGANLRDARLWETDLTQANLTRVDFAGAHLDSAKLSGADLRGAYFNGSSLTGADLRGANLNGTSFHRTDLRSADLRNAGLNGARLSESSLVWTQLAGTNFTGVQLSQTTLACDLSEVTSLEKADHGSPSYVSLDALTLSRGRIAPSFLRGCGLADWEIAGARIYDPDLTREEVDAILYEVSALRAGAAIQISPLFISYSRADAEFVDGLEVWLNEKGIRFWRDVHNLKAGRMETQIMHAISMNPSFLLVLSKHSVNSDWVEWEAAKARELEKELGRNVLCPVALDDSWKSSRWPGPLRRQIENYVILDFSHWKDAESFKEQFEKLTGGLALYYPRAGDR